MNELSITAIPKALRYIVAFSKTISADLALFVKTKVDSKSINSFFILVYFKNYTTSKEKEKNVSVF